MIRKVVHLELLDKNCKSQIIEHCDDCPLCSIDWEDCKYCVLGANVKPLGCNADFPVDCPLPDFKDKQEYKAKIEFSVSATFDEPERNFETMRYCITDDLGALFNNGYDLISEIKITEIE